MKRLVIVVLGALLLVAAPARADVFDDNPAAASRGAGDMVVVARGADGAIYERHLEGGAWTAWSSIGGIATSGPAAAAYGDAIHVFVLGTRLRRARERASRRPVVRLVLARRSGIVGARGLRAARNRLSRSGRSRDGQSDVVQVVRSRVRLVWRGRRWAVASPAVRRSTRRTTSSSTCGAAGSMVSCSSGRGTGPPGETGSRRVARWSGRRRSSRGKRTMSTSSPAPVAAACGRKWWSGTTGWSGWFPVDPRPLDSTPVAGSDSPDHLVLFARSGATLLTKQWRGGVGWTDWADWGPVAPPAPPRTARAAASPRPRRHRPPGGRPALHSTRRPPARDAHGPPASRNAACTGAPGCLLRPQGAASHRPPCALSRPAAPQPQGRQQGPRVRPRRLHAPGLEEGPEQDRVPPIRDVRMKRLITSILADADRHCGARTRRRLRRQPGRGLPRRGRSGRRRPRRRRRDLRAPPRGRRVDGLEVDRRRHDVRPGRRGLRRRHPCVRARPELHGVRERPARRTVVGLEVARRRGDLGPGRRGATRHDPARPRGAQHQQRDLPPRLPARRGLVAVGLAGRQPEQRSRAQLAGPGRPQRVGARDQRPALPARLDGTAWRGWEARGGGLVGAPSTISRRQNVVDIFARGANGALYQKSWTGTTSWIEWALRDARPLDSTPGAASDTADHVVLFARSGATMLIKEWRSGSGWTPWSDWGPVAPPPPPASPAATAPATARERARQPADRRPLHPARRPPEGQAADPQAPRRRQAARPPRRLLRPAHGRKTDRHAPYVAHLRLNRPAGSAAGVRPRVLHPQGLDASSASGPSRAAS